MEAPNQFSLNMEDSRKLKVGIAGFGVVGSRRYHVLKDHEAFDVIGVSDIAPNKVPSDIGIPTFEDRGKLFELPLDVLFVCLPNFLAAETTIAGLKQGFHVFCEKPPGRTVEEVYRVREIEKERPAQKLKYGFNHRFHDSVQDALTIVSRGDLGKIINMRGVYGKGSFFGAAGPDWRTDRDKAGGGILLDQGIHLVDLMRLFAGEFAEVKSFVENSFWKADVEDNAYALLRTTDGKVASLHSSATQWQHKFELEICFEGGAVILSGILSGSKSYGEERITILKKTEKPGVFSTETTKYLEDHSWANEIDDFANHILKDEIVTRGNSEDALRSMELVQAIYIGDSSSYSI